MIRILILLLGALGLQSFFVLDLSGQGMGRPNQELRKKLLNPYDALSNRLVGVAEHHENPGFSAWRVFADRQDAPFFVRTAHGFEASGKTADFLQEFAVHERSGSFLRVGRNRWIRMRNLLMFRRPIAEPASGIYFKVFPKVRIDDPRQASREVLRFRDAPGYCKRNEPVIEGSRSCEGTFAFLSKADEEIRSAGVFLYVYAVDFGDDPEEGLADYSQYREAKFFLVGSSTGFLSSRRHDAILGWLPAAGAIAWDTRQALDVEEDRDANLGHRFSKQSQFRRYMASGDQKIDQFKFMRRDIVKDEGGVLFRQGTELRFIVHEEFDEVVRGQELNYARIGYSGQDSASATPKTAPVGSLDLVDLQRWGKELEIYFLLDATTSMQPCFEAAARMVENIRRKTGARFHAAVYRDRRDPRRRFEEWPGEAEQPLADWLREVSVGDRMPDPTFEEDLLQAMEIAARSWRAKFRSNLSTRVMVILGDAGWEWQPGDRTPDQVLETLKANIILPLAIQFTHPTRVGEQEALDAFQTQLGWLLKRFYGSDHPAIEAVPIGRVTDTLESRILSVSKAFEDYVSQMTRVRLGTTTILKGLCAMAFQGALKTECQSNARTLEDIQDRVSRYRDQLRPQSGEVDDFLAISFTLNALEVLRDHRPELVDLLSRHPQLGYQEGYVAIRVNGEAVTRPVYLFTDVEMTDIRSLADQLVGGECELEKTEKFLKHALAYILGQGLVINLEDLTEEHHSAWLKRVVEQERSALSYSRVARNLCHQDQWEPFVRSIESVPRVIAEIRESKSRTFYGPNGEHLYWVFPEEILPVAN